MAVLKGDDQRRRPFHRGPLPRPARQQHPRRLGVAVLDRCVQSGGAVAALGILSRVVGPRPHLLHARHRELAREYSRWHLEVEIGTSVEQGCGRVGEATLGRQVAVVRIVCVEKATQCREE